MCPRAWIPGQDVRTIMASLSCACKNPASEIVSLSPRELQQVGPGFTTCHQMKVSCRNPGTVLYFLNTHEVKASASSYRALPPHAGTQDFAKTSKSGHVQGHAESVCHRLRHCSQRPWEVVTDTRQARSWGHIAL